VEYTGELFSGPVDSPETEWPGARGRATAFLVRNPDDTMPAGSQMRSYLTVFGKTIFQTCRRSVIIKHGGKYA
jgi:hypothetical protein